MRTRPEILGAVLADGATFMNNDVSETFTATGTTFTLFSQSTAGATPRSYASVFKKQ